MTGAAERGSGFKRKFGCLAFRASGITAYLEGGGTLENAGDGRGSNHLVGRQTACVRDRMRGVERRRGSQAGRTMGV